MSMMSNLPRPSPRRLRMPAAGALAAVMAVSSGASVLAQSSLQFFLSITDASGAAVTDITVDELTILEDGVAGRVTALERVDWPVRVQVLVDNGLGMGAENLLHIRNGVRALFEALPAGVEASLITMAPQPRTVVATTAEQETLARGVTRITPDTGATRFVDAMVEAGARIDRERQSRGPVGPHFPVIVVIGSTGPELSSALERDVNRLVDRLVEHAATVHAVVVTTGARGVLEVSGTRQTIVGAAAAEATGGRYEALAAPSRLATLLPEIGEQIARSHELQSGQYRVTFERPGTGNGVGLLEMEPLRPGLEVLGTFDGRIP